MTADDRDPRRIVADGYDAISHQYRADDFTPPQYVGWLAELLRTVPAHADVLDLGCGNGVPVARDLAVAGHHVTGVDVSPVQLERARALVPGATFVLGDMAEVAFGPASFDAVVCLYALIHVPAEEHPAVLRRIAGWLRPGGHLLLVTGDTAWTGTEDDWLGAGATMWWSHPDRERSRRWLEEAGFVVDDEGFVPEGDGGHALFRAHRS